MSSNRLLGLVADGPPLLLTLGASLVVGGLLPAGVQLALWSAGAMVVVLVRLGAWEDPATRLLVGCRPVRPPELDLLRPALSDLVGKTATPSCLYVSCRGAAPPFPVSAIGRLSVVVTPAFLHGLSQRRIGVAEAAKAMGYAEAWRAAGRPEWDLALRFLLQPGRWARRCGAPLVRPFLSLPLIINVWRLRWVVALVAVGDSARQGHAAAGVMAAVLIAASYLSPAASRARHRRRHLAAIARLPHPRPAPSTLPSLAIASQPAREGVPPSTNGAPGTPKPQRERHLTVVR